jgi:type II secretory pathway pseudopilin PulG
MDTPPPLPSTSSLVPAPAPRKSNAVLWIAIGAAVLVGVVTVVGILTAILIPTVGKVRATALRTADGSNLRQIGQAALVYAIDHDGACPPLMLSADGQAEGNTPATIHAVAAALARDGGLNDATMWLAGADRNVTRPVLSADRASVDEDFELETAFAWDFATGVHIAMPPTTPIAWTRGLREDGTWGADGVYGPEGGHIMFLGGNVQFFRDLISTPLVRPDGTTTSNILETLPTTARVVGSGAGTLHGARGKAMP